MNMNAYVRLMRFHKPMAIALLWAPTAWALWLSNRGVVPFALLAYFLLGTLLMRAAGCVVNDMADRSIDKHVKRTCLRPLTTGELGTSQAMWLLAGLLSLAGLIVTQLPIACFYYAIAALLITVLYPFCKRFIQAPQLVLGVAFSMGIPMAYAAMHVALTLSAFILMILNFVWIVSYDTLYAMVDRDDDLRIGVHSTAVLFAQYDRLIVLLMQLVFHGLWLILAFINHFSFVFYVGWFLGALILAYQQVIIASRDASACLRAFNLNGWYGLLMWIALMVQ